MAAGEDGAGGLDTVTCSGRVGRRRPTLGTLVVAAALAAAACGGGAPGEAEADRELVVSAAASLTDAFGAMERSFEAAHPGVDVRLNLAGSSTLRMQILEGAPVDVFASADTANMERVAAAGEVAGEPRIFARNRLQIAVPAGNPAGIDGLEDFADEDLLLGLCAAEVPCGALAREALRKAGVRPAVDTHEPDVRALLTKVAAGELDAGLVYRTDVIAASEAVDGVDLPGEARVVAEYPIAALRRSAHPAAAERFVDFVLSGKGRAVLAELGFAPPSDPGSPPP